MRRRGRGFGRAGRLGNPANRGPVLMYGVLKLTGFAGIVTSHLWLKKGKRVKNLTVPAT